MRKPLPLAALIVFTTVMLAAREGHAQPPPSDSRQLNDAAQSDRPPPPSRQRSVDERPKTLIACTRTGCRPIPPGCWIEIERNWDGLPTGFDAIICPFR